MQAFEEAGAAAEVGARIKQARRQAGMTQADMASLLPFSERSLQDYENGVTLPYKHLAAISRVLNRPVEWFLHGDPEEPAPKELTERVKEVRRLLEELGVKVDELKKDVHDLAEEAIRRLAALEAGQERGGHRSDRGS